MIYIGHDYHLKTKSTRFLIDIFKEKYEVDEATYDMEKRQFSILECCQGKKYDVLVLFQMPVPSTELKSKFRYKKAAYFPMYDGTGEAPDSFWADYKDFNIVNFSSTLHNRLIKMGFSSYYIQYYPKPVDNIEWGNKKSAFFWHRTNYITINTVAGLVRQLDLEHIHLHIAEDPGIEDVQPDKEVSEHFHITTSQWFNAKEDMLEEIKKSSYYIAPRLYEGIGMSFLEAMAMGRCVVAANHPTMNEYICNGENGLLYDYGEQRIINPDDVRILQEKAYKNIVNGYAAWERDKHNILDWLEAETKADIKKFENNSLTKPMKNIFKRIKIFLRK